MNRTQPAILATGLTLALTVLPALAADHRESPALSPALHTARMDINDIYIFESPATPSNVVLIMTTNPFIDAGEPQPPFSDRASYQFLLDEDGDGRDEMRLNVRFDPPASDGAQRVRLRGAGLRATGLTGQSVPVRNSTGERVGTLRASIFDDPFFFDARAFAGGSSTDAPGDRLCEGGGEDLFAGFNVLGIVIEVDARLLPERFDASARTRLNRVTLDRVGYPYINTVLIPDALTKVVYNQSPPRLDEPLYADTLAASMVALGNDPDTAARTAAVLLPDTLRYDRRAAPGFPNGRSPHEDAMDTVLQTLSGGRLQTDCVDRNDAALPNAFPYLGQPH